MAKRTTTTTTTFLPPFNYDDSEINESCEINVATQGFLNGVDFYVYLLALSPLAVCFLCCFPSYLAAFRRNAEAISASPFLPLINHSYRTIAFNYTTCIILGVLSKLFLDSGSRIPGGAIAINLFVVSLLVIYWYTTMYQLTISIITIHKFINIQKPVKSLSKKNIVALIVVTFILVMAKDISWFAWMVNILMEAKCEMVDTLFMYYLIIYMTQQLFLFIAMALQLIIKKLPGSYSEYAIATHTKYIGAVKLVLGIIGVICFLNNLINAVTLTVFLGIDIFLVPVVIQVTEIRADPNVIKPVKFQKTPEKS